MFNLGSASALPFLLFLPVKLPRCINYFGFDEFPLSVRDAIWNTKANQPWMARTIAGICSNLEGTLLNIFGADGHTRM